MPKVKVRKGETVKLVGGGSVTLTEQCGREATFDVNWPRSIWLYKRSGRGKKLFGDKLGVDKTEYPDLN